MKNTFLRHKFKNFKFVKPLYRKVGKVKPKLTISVENTKLRGDGFCVKRNIFYGNSVDFDLINKCKNSDKSLPGTCENIKAYTKNNRNANNDKVFRIKDSKLGKMSSVIDRKSSEDVLESKLNKSVQAENKVVYPQQNPGCWLKVYPASERPGDSVCSVVFRCLFCQLGLASFLVLWTLLWLFVINAYEEPHEHTVSLEFKKQQNQLVIDLATELRQITPIAPKWLKVIEQRIEDERLLTMLAVGRGAILHPGHYWQLAGTFLFTVYVMTALGFGAPVPQTLWGRTAALVYALLAVPTHFYLMVNLSTCVVTKVDYCIRKRSKKKVDKSTEGIISRKNTGSPNCSRNSDVKKRRMSFRQKILHSLRFLWKGRFVPLAAVLYYTLGAVSFGVLRGKKGLDVAMFPLEFTTSGGLEHVEEHVRLLYGIYVEGAMTLLSCVLATIRLHSTAAAYSVADHYQLFVYNTDV